MNIPGNCRYTREHEWARLQNGKIVIGITDYAQQELGDVVFVELPQLGAAVTKGESFANVESVKAVSDVYAPVDGIVRAVNEPLADSPERINNSPYDNGWIIEVEPSDSGQFEELFDAAQYASYVEEISK